MTVVTVEQRGPVSVIAINRPEKLNAINKAVAIELQQAFAAFDRSEQRVAILTGTGGRAFSSGADVTDLPELWRCVPTVGIATDKPIIAAVAGWCIGGGLVMAMMCDLLVAADNARFSYPEGKVGITGGMIAGLAARIPHKVAMEMMLVGEPIDAARAYAVGRQADRPTADAVFLSGTGMPTLPILQALEDDLGKPVISANSAMMWNALRIAGVTRPTQGHGRLFDRR